MYKTVQELHIEIEQRINQITSNRHGAIAPEFIDMMLNRTARKYVTLKTNRKTNYKQEGFEDSKKRLEDLVTLKKVTGWEQVYKEDDSKSYTLLPEDYMMIVNSQSKYKYDRNKTDDWDVSEDTGMSIIHFNVKDFINKLENINTGYVMFNFGRDSLRFSIDSLKNKEVFELSNILLDVFLTTNFNTNHKFYWESFDGIYKSNAILCVELSHTDYTLNITFTDDATSDYSLECKRYQSTKNYSPYNINPDKISPNDLISSELIPSLLQDSYSCKNRHLNPITEIVNDRLYVYHNDDFRVGNIKITYIKRPRLFDITRDQMSDLTITPEFMDMVVSDILLILKDNSFNYVKQKTNLE